MEKLLSVNPLDHHKINEMLHLLAERGLTANSSVCFHRAQQALNCRVSELDRELVNSVGQTLSMSQTTGPAMEAQVKLLQSIDGIHTASAQHAWRRLAAAVQTKVAVVRMLPQPLPTGAAACADPGEDRIIVVVDISLMTPQFTAALSTLLKAVVELATISSAFTHWTPALRTFFADTHSAIAGFCGKLQSSLAAFIEALMVPPEVVSTGAHQVWIDHLRRTKISGILRLEVEGLLDLKCSEKVIDAMVSEATMLHRLGDHFFGDGESLRDFTCIDDASGAIHAILGDALDFTCVQLVFHVREDFSVRCKLVLERAKAYLRQAALAAFAASGDPSEPSSVEPWRETHAESMRKVHKVLQRASDSDSTYNEAVKAWVDKMSGQVQQLFAEARKRSRGYWQDNIPSWRSEDEGEDVCNAFIAALEKGFDDAAQNVAANTTTLQRMKDEAGG